MRLNQIKTGLRLYREQGLAGVARVLLQKLAEPPNARGGNSKSAQPKAIKQLRACHLHELFPNHDGNVFPCCLTWGRPEMNIGNLKDPNLSNKILCFRGTCSCERYELRAALPSDTPDYAVINIEFPLTCQGKCAMCAVRAPDWKGSYEYYDSLAQLVMKYLPKRLSVQGGEVLIQKKTIAWLYDIKERLPHLEIGLITNGNVPLDSIFTVEDLFNDVWISFVGFQPETYARIMGMDVTKAILFSEELVRRNKVQVTLKYLTTPLNVHETSVFLKWGIGVLPKQCAVQDASLLAYINRNTSDNFWDKLFDRTGIEIKRVIDSNRERLRSAHMKIIFENRCLQIYGIDDHYLEKNSDIVGRMLN
jgi:hypothetical protein